MHVDDRKILVGFLVLLTLAVGAWLYVTAEGGLFPPSVPLPTGRVAWKYVVIHHSGTDAGNAVAFDRYHREVKGWRNGLAYHFVIGNGNGSGDGKLEIGKRWINQQPGAHAGDPSINNVGIGICLVGDFTKSKPTSRQLRRLVDLLALLCSTYRIPPERVLKHGDITQTQCPGPNFHHEEILSELRARLQSTEFDQQSR